MVMAIFAADRLLGRIAKNYDKTMEAYAPDFVTEVIAALNQDALHPDPASPYNGKLLTDDKYLPLLGTVPVWRFTALEPATIQKIGIRNLQWLDISKTEGHYGPMSRERFGNARYATWMDHAVSHRLWQQYPEENFQKMFDKGWVQRSMTFPPVGGENSALNIEFDSITHEEFLGQIARSVRYIAEHIPMESAALKSLGKETKEGLLYTGDGILQNDYFMQALCKRQEAGLLEGNGADQPLTNLFFALKERLGISSQPLDYLRGMPLRGRDFAMITEARIKTNHRDIHSLGFNLDTLAEKARIFSAVPELMMVASNRVMEELAPRLKDWPHSPRDWQYLRGMDFSRADMPSIDLLQRGIKAVLPPRDEDAIKEVLKQAKEINPQCDLDIAQFINRLERITYNLSPAQLATLQLEQELQPQFWNKHVTSIAQPPFNAHTPEDAVGWVTKMANTKVITATMGDAHKPYVHPHRASVLSLVNHETLGNALSLEQLAAVLENEKIGKALDSGEKQGFINSAGKRIEKLWEHLGIYYRDPNDHRHFKYYKEPAPERTPLYALGFTEAREYLHEIIEVMAKGSAALGEAFEGCPVIHPNPASTKEEERDYYRITLGKNQQVNAGLVEQLKHVRDIPPQWKEQIKYPESGGHISRDILIHKDMAHHVKFADFVKEPTVARAIGAAAASHAASITKDTGERGI